MNLRRIATLATYPLEKYGTCMFAVTNLCNAHCKFCSIPNQSNNGMISVNDAKAALDNLYLFGVRYIQFTGGEPLLYPHLLDVIAHGNHLGMIMTLVTNSSLLSESKAQLIVHSGLQSVSISVDHFDPCVYESNRGIKGLATQMQAAVQWLREEGMPIQASTTISKLLVNDNGDYEKMVENNIRLGFDGTYFCYPMVNMHSNYALGGEIVNYSASELSAVIRHIQDLKRKGFPIDNSDETLEDVISFLKEKPAKYPCVAGYKVFYLDWNLNLYNCMTQGRLLGRILDLNAKLMRFKRIECEDCILSCNREPSIYQHGTKSVVPFLGLVGDVVKRGVRF
jgi:MoaA/NifB/PqqE/SkfB family radical SAM enzyme